MGISDRMYARSVRQFSTLRNHLSREEGVFLQQAFDPELRKVWRRIGYNEGSRDGCVSTYHSYQLF